jgi:hypothetical protein
MTKPALYALLTAFLIMPAWAGNESHPVFELSKGEAGRLMLVAQSDERERESRLDSVGLRGEYRNGQLLWVDRRQDGGTVIGLGYQKRF